MTVKTTSNGRLPIRSDNEPITGNQNKFDRPTQSVTSSASLCVSLSMSLPKVGV
jgi:hypothetical protein